MVTLTVITMSDDSGVDSGNYNISFAGPAERDEKNPYCKKGCTCGCHMMGDGALCDPGEKCFMGGCVPKIQPEQAEYTPFD